MKATTYVRYPKPLRSGKVLADTRPSRLAGGSLLPRGNWGPCELHLPHELDLRRLDPAPERLPRIPAFRDACSSRSESFLKQTARIAARATSQASRDSDGPWADIRASFPRET